MRIIIGLGNPGDEYKLTRHNAGVMMVDKLASLPVGQLHSDYGWRRRNSMMMYEGQGVVLVKTADMFMNESGRLIHDLRFTKYDLGDLWVAHDDLDLRLGDFKIQKGRGPKVHNGVESVENALGTRDFWRIRIGIDNRMPENRIDGETYVLQKFSREELGKIDQTVEGACTQLFDNLKR